MFSKTAQIDLNYKYSSTCFTFARIIDPNLDIFRSVTITKHLIPGIFKYYILNNTLPVSIRCYCFCIVYVILWQIHSASIDAKTTNKCGSGSEKAFYLLLDVLSREKYFTRRKREQKRKLIHHFSCIFKTLLKTKRYDCVQFGF